MPRTKQNNPKNLKDKIEEAQKELKHPKTSQKDVTESTGRNSECIKGLKRKKIVAQSQLKKIPKSPVKNQPQIQKSSSPETSTSSKEAIHTSLSTCPSSDLCDPQDSVSSESEVGTVKDESVISDSLGQSQKAEKLKERKKSETTGSVLVQNKDGSKSALASQTSAPLDVLLKAMEPDFDTLTERKNNSLIGHCGKSVSIPVTYSDFAVAMPAVNFSLQSQRSFVPPFTPTKQFYNSMESAQQNTKSQFPNIAGTRQQDKSGFLKSYSVGPSLNLTHSTVPSGTGGLPQSQPPVVQTCQSLSATVPSSIQVPVTPGFNPVQMTTVVKLGSHVSDVSKEQKTKKQGKYVCEYCKRACAKPSVLLKHIRSHTGERPYPCVTCGFSFKTKSNLYKHKKSHAHAIKLGLVKDPGSGSLSQESDKGLATNSDAEESGESEEDGSAADLDTEISRSLTVLTDSSLPNTVTIPVSQEDSDNMLEFETVKPLVTQRGCEPMVTAGLPKVVVHPVNFSPLRADSPRAPDCAPEHATAQRQRDSQPANLRSSVTIFSSVKEADCPNFLPEAVSEDEDHNCKSPLTGTHAQLQRQQATDYSQQQQAKCLLSPRSLGSTDSGYFSRSESADQAMSPPSPFVKIISPAETDLTKLSKMTHSPVVPSVVHVATVGKPRVLSGQMRPPLETKALSLEERISKLISENEAVVDDKQLDSVKPRRTSLSRRGSIDSPKSYIFKDSFQFDLKPPVRRSSSNSDIPKSPFTPTESSKQIFLLSVPSQYPTMDSLPITRSNSVPTTPGQSAVFANVTPQAHQLRICQSFDEKIGSLNDDVFSSAPSTPGPAVHSRTLRRQKAVDVLSSNDSYALISVQSLNNHHESTITPELRSKSFEHSTERIRKLQQNKGTMYECETCRNRYRKLENFENHKKFYCSELHGPKTKLVNVREIESDVFGPGLNQSLLNRSAIITGIVEPQMIVRKRRKIKSVGDDDDQSPTETTPPCSRSFDSCNVSTNLKGQSFTQNTQSVSNSAVVAQVQCIGRTVEQQESRLSPISESQICTPNKEHGDLLREGSGTSVIRHTNSLSRPHSFETSEDRSSPADLVENELTYKGQRDAEVSSLTQSFCEGLSTSKFVSQCHDDKQNFVVVSNSCMTAQQSRLVRQKNIQVPEILVTEEPDRDHIAELAEKPAETFNWPQRSESLSKLPTEKLPPKKKRIRLAQMEHSSGESSFDSSLSRSLSRDSSLSRCSSISASFEREDPPRPDSPSKVESVGKPQQAHGSPVTGNTLGVPGTMRRATSEQISCTQSTVEISDYRSKSFDCSSITYSRPLSPVSTIMPKTTQCPPITSVPLIERRRGPLVRQMSLKIAPDPQIGVKQLVSIQRHPFGNQGSLAQPRSINVSKPPGQSLVLNYGEVVQKKQEQMVQSINLGSQTQQPQIPGLPHPWHQSSRVSVSPVQPLVCTVQGHGDIQNPPDEQKKSFVPKYQLNCLIKKIDQMQSLERMHGTQKTTPADNEIKVSKSNDAIENVNVEQPNCDALIMMPQVVQFDEILHATSGSTSVPEILITDEHTPTSLASKAIPLGNFVKRDLKPAQQIHTPLETSSVAIQLKNYIKADQTLGAKKSNLALGSLHCTQKLASTNLCPQEGTASSKRMLSPANSLDIAMEKTQKRAKDEHGIACLTVGRSLGYANSKMSEITRQRKLMLVRQFCTTDPADSPIETDVPEQLPEQTSVHQPASASEFNDQEMESRTPTSTVPTVFATRSSPGGQSSPVLEISSLKPLDKPDEHRWSPSKSQIRPTNIQGKVKLASSVSVVNTRDSHRLSFPSLKTATTFTWCFLLKRRALHVEQTDSRTSAYSSWLINPNNPNPLGLPTKVVMSLFDSKLTSKKIYYTQAKTTTLKSDILTYSPKLKDILPKVLIQKPAIAEKIGNLKPGSQQMSQTESDKDSSKSEPQRVKIFDGGYKSTEEYVYVRGRGRGKYICEECGIRCKKPSMLRKHIRTHSDIRPFHCTHCNFSFKTKGNLTKHMKSKAHSKKCLEMGVAVGVIDEQDTEDSGDQGRTEISDRQDSDGDDSDGQDEDDNDEEDEEDSQAESGLSAAPSVSASPQHLPPIQNDLAPSSLLAQMCISQNPSSASQHPPPSDSQTSETYSPSMKSPVSMVRQMSISAPCSSPTAISSTLTYPTAPAVESQASDTDSVQMMSPVSPCRQMSIDYPDFDAPRTLPVTNKGPKLGQDGASSPLSQPTCENNANVDRGTQTSSDSLQGPLHFPTVVSVEEPRVGSTTHLYSHLPLHSQQPPRSPYSMVPVGGIQLVPAGLAAYSTFVPIQAGPVQLTIPALSVIHRQSGSPLPATSPLAQSDGIQTQSLVIQDPVSSVLPCLPLSQVAGLQTLGTPHTSVQSVGLGNLSVLGLTNSTQLVPQQSIPLKATLGVQVLATSPGLQSSTASPTPIPGLQILNITLPALIPSISPLSALGSFPPTQEQPSSESVAVPAPHRTPPAPVSSASPPIATRCDFPTSATLSTKLVSQTGHISGDKRETEKSNGESSILSSSPSSNGVRGSDAPQKGSAIDEVRPWQTDDDNAASSDDEDRLVIAT